MDPGGLQDRFRGAIVGTAVGDALGAPFEGVRRVDPAALAGWQDAPDPLRWTDDTAMTVGVAESLTACSGFDGGDMARRFVAHYDAEPWRGYGAAPPRVFAALREGAPWDAPARRLFAGRGSFGNGAAMRAAPIGLYFYRDLDAAVRVARAAAGITHTHELGRQGAALQAYAAGRLLSSRGPAANGSAGSLLQDLRPVAPAPAYQRRLDALAALPDDASPAAVVDALGHGTAAVESVPAALRAVLRHPRSFAGAVGYAIALGGDTDTIGAMAGALSGALLGWSAIPEQWRQRLEALADLRDLADALHARATR